MADCIEMGCQDDDPDNSENVHSNGLLQVRTSTNLAVALVEDMGIDDPTPRKVNSECVENFCGEMLDQYKCSNVDFEFSDRTPGPEARWSMFLDKCRAGCATTGGKSNNSHNKIYRNCRKSALSFLGLSSSYCGPARVDLGSAGRKAREEDAHRRYGCISAGCTSTCVCDTFTGTGNFLIDAFVAGCQYVKETAYLPPSPPTSLPTPTPTNDYEGDYYTDDIDYYYNLRYRTDHYKARPNSYWDSGRATTVAS